MEQRELDNKKKDKGFTLIELLIVIVILGILATVVVFAVGGITDRGERSACKADYATMEVAIEAYNAQTGDYPADGTADDTDAVLVPEYMRTASDAYNVGADGVIVLDSVNPNECTAPPTD